MGDVGVICHTIYVSNLNEKIKKPILKKSLHRYDIQYEYIYLWALFYNRRCWS